MLNFKSHFLYTKQQRGGIFLLLVLIVVLQFVYRFVEFPTDLLALNDKQMLIYQAEIDSLVQISTSETKPEIYPFNPNFISDYKGYTLGMSTTEIDRLHAFREQNKWINSVHQFQEITQISDSLLNVISPYFKFPEWVTNPKRNNRRSSETYEPNTPKSYAQKQDLNNVTAAQLQIVRGIGIKLSERIVNYRTRIGGFIADVQVKEVYGLSPEVIERLLNEFTVKSPRSIKKVNINTATIDELVTVEYIDYEIASHIIEQRILHDGFLKIEELTKVKGFPVNKIEIIELYLTFD